MSKVILNKLRISVLISLVLCIVISMVSFDAKCEDLRNNVFRLHILANSDSEADQQLKLLVRDEILKTGCVEFENCIDLNEAIVAAENSVDTFKAVAEKVIRSNGYAYSVQIDIDKAYFDTREYDEFTLPAGFYNSLIVKIGEGKGKNWWCVMFPALCVPSADAELGDSVNDDSAQIATNSKNYKIRFKTVEIFEYFKKIILNK